MNHENCSWSRQAGIANGENRYGRTGYDTGGMSCDVKPPSLGTLDLIRKREPGKSITAGRINEQIHIAYACVVF